jgi:hypothetical protein
LPLLCRAPGGDDGDGEAFPDLIEDDARDRTLPIRGTLWAEGARLRVNLLLKCSSSRFADQFTVVHRSADAVGTCCAAPPWRCVRAGRILAAVSYFAP